MKVLEWSAAILSIIATAWLAHDASSVRWVFLLYGVANIMWIVFAFSKKSYGLLAMNAGYAIISIYGIYQNWIV